MGSRWKAVLKTLVGIIRHRVIHVVRPVAEERNVPNLWCGTMGWTLHRLALVILVVMGFFEETSCSYPVIEGVMYAPDVLSILSRDCLRPGTSETSTYAAVPPKSTELLSGVFIRSHCPQIEVVLWYERPQRALWVNPNLAISGFLLDSEVAIGDDVGVKAFQKALNSAWGGKPSFSTAPVGTGCVNEGDPNDRTCHGNANMHRFKDPQASIRYAFDPDSRYGRRHDKSEPVHHGRR
ncbi:UL1 [anatid alphaherpesvirus 1]|uniref:UL1 n=1 Tax=anatid alphaherpesvirus 1 TaxID=104388 RepID=C6ZD36_9ALPH|nr:UL1 [Anatid alphaherpesvirus 1]ACT83571.1 UL1 [Anatid alphaherpesvirus 1]